MKKKTVLKPVFSKVALEQANTSSTSDIDAAIPDEALKLYYPIYDRSLQDLQSTLKVYVGSLGKQFYLVSTDQPYDVRRGHGHQSSYYEFFRNEYI